jgi:hypothetical protein
MLNEADRKERARGIRDLLRDYLNRTHNRDNDRVCTIPHELLEAWEQLELLIKLETPGTRREREQDRGEEQVADEVHRLKDKYGAMDDGARDEADRLAQKYSR